MRRTLEQDYKLEHSEQSAAANFVAAVCSANPAELACLAGPVDPVDFAGSVGLAA